jgi:hypothetical protein
MKRYEYTEGKAAQKKFESAMKTIFRAPKRTKAEKPKKGASSQEKPDASGKD